MKHGESLSSPANWALVDVVAVERQARAMQAQVLADFLRSALRGVAGWLRRSPSGQTA
jgi:hypothetical protein